MEGKYGICVGESHGTRIHFGDGICYGFWRDFLAFFRISVRTTPRLMAEQEEGGAGTARARSYPGLFYMRGEKKKKEKGKKKAVRCWLWPPRRKEKKEKKKKGRLWLWLW